MSSLQGEFHLMEWDGRTEEKLYWRGNLLNIINTLTERYTTNVRLSE